MRFKEIEFYIIFVIQQISLFLRACVFSFNSTGITCITVIFLKYQIRHKWKFNISQYNQIKHLYIATRKA